MRGKKLKVGKAWDKSQYVAGKRHYCLKMLTFKSHVSTLFYWPLKDMSWSLIYYWPRLAFKSSTVYLFKVVFFLLFAKSSLGLIVLFK